MKKSTKIWIGVIISFIVICALVFFGILMIATSGIIKGDRWSDTSNLCEITEDFDNVMINSSATEIVVVPLNGTTCKIEYPGKNRPDDFAVVYDRTLRINTESNEKWYDSIDISHNEPRVTVYLPVEKYVNSLEINTKSGDIDIARVNMMEVKLSSDAGECELKNVNCDNLYAKTTAGDVNIERVIAKDKFNIETTTGDVEFEDSDAGEISVKTTTGDVEGSLRTDKTFVTQTTVGQVRVPRGTTGGRCEITTSTGDIEIDTYRGMID